MRASHSLRRFVLLSLLLFPLSALAGGCGSSEGTVSGTVSYKGKPVKAGAVYFFPESKSGNYTSVIGTDGTYSISKLPVGPAKISVTIGTQSVPASVFQQMSRGGNFGKGGGGNFAEKALKKNMTEEAKKNAEAEAKESAAVSPKYANPDKSGLTINVTGGKQTHDIKME